MKLYLVQHGPAATKEEDPDRPLTAPGHALVGRVAEALARTGAVRPAEIRHSGKLRARQSAEALATGLGLEVAITAAPDLGPTDDPQDAAAALAGENQDLMLVGHLPHLGRREQPGGVRRPLDAGARARAVGF
ncbi:histidine phosphatase family protein [Aquisalimonas sp.]|uniref:SixA phosphatase family protein n=1 Tax=Aquisalimonas sp. TaxID=1872621 RepID=UPI0025C40A6C|nr:histidine phosphatase family protein [Aquisalimonas sp.]